MKILSNRALALKSSNDMPVALTVSVTKLSDKTAQLIVCDNENAFTNMVCVMNMTGTEKECTATIVFDDPTGSGTGTMQEELASEESGITADMTKAIGIKVCFKASLTQLYLSFNVSLSLTRLLEHDYKMKLMLEK